MRVRVLVESPLARAGAELLRRAGIPEQLAVGGGRTVGVLDDEELAAGLEPRLDPVVRVRDDRRARHRELERASGRRRPHGRVRAARHVERDARRRDRAVERVERDHAERARAADVALEVLAAEREVHVRQAARRLADELAHPLAPELVAVAVEEDVVRLLDRQRLEELRVGRPEERLGAARAELAQAVEPALRVRDDEVVLARVGAVVVVEAGVHAAELGQAHRNVAVVEDDGHAEALAKRRRYAAQVRHRHREDEHRVDVALALEDPLDVPLPARRDPAPHHFPDQPVGVARVGLLTPEVPIALQARPRVARAREALALEVGGVRRGAPPRRLDRAAAVRRHDQVDADLVEAFPELPPRRRAAVPEVEIDRRGDREDLRGLHRARFCPSQRLCPVKTLVTYGNSNVPGGASARTRSSSSARSSSGSPR